jgi:hypothetical protein
MAFIGVAKGFAQRHSAAIISPYCPQIIIDKAGDFERSAVTLNSIRSDVQKFAQWNPSVRPRNELFDETVRAAFNKFQVTQVNPIHLNDLPKLHQKTDVSSPGIPWKDLGFKTKREVLDDKTAFQSIRRFWHRVKRSEDVRPADCSAFMRAHIVKKGDIKVRAVWGYPATISFMEACFALPLLEKIKWSKTPMAYGYETAKGGSSRVKSRFSGYNQYLGADFKDFDKTVPAWLIRIAFDIVLSNFDLRKYKDEGTPNTGELAIVWEYIVDYFIKTPIRLCNGERYRKMKGVASGSYFTQIIDSIVNWIVIVYCLKKQGMIINDLLVLGDDSLVALQGQCDLELLDREMEESFGMKLNTKKSIQSKRLSDIVFLGYLMAHSPTKDEASLYAALAFPETPDKYIDQFVTRAVGLCIANFAVHTEFDRSCRIISQIPHKNVVTPSLRRFLDQMGIDQVPALPPDQLDLYLMSH